MTSRRRNHLFNLRGQQEGQRPENLRWKDRSNKFSLVVHHEGPAVRLPRNNVVQTILFQFGQHVMHLHRKMAIGCVGGFACTAQVFLDDVGMVSIVVLDLLTLTVLL
jgi:hypothetical protein